ncbi:MULTISPECIES: TonB-dependent siderophore receptor [unclassified Pseudomonas]|uniref:TonB-dependent siderophore receptor n=1 Tax=unclassified Pseudomonas TaxID=196821 RepID=UPI00244AA639|nr:MULTISPECIES: TonB-dependent siderophore receptor [unclassified Pseudomonas]MDG9929270.1 TonB-dependent siderophore receptor [Pseudomonas sp. GD04042]MDH0485478.1 TonB-dependent siderophore receptor [Pseudomonas sp. GD04015]MDH0607019.1 TonB-dependent siderophore receptor [Pseudomonas sp. GD03869]
MRPTRLNPASLALAVSLATSGTLALLPVHATLAAEARLGFDIASGPLEQTLRQIARQSGRVIAADPALLQGKRSAAVRGDFNAEEAVRQALSGTNLQLLVTDNGTLTVQVVETGSALQLGATSISTSRLGATTEGTGSYTTGATSTATKMNLSIRETPQSISVVTRQQMNDQNMQSLEDVAMAATGINTVKGFGTERPLYYARGFQVDDLQVDGLPTSVTESFSMDVMSVNNMAMYDRVEIVRGANGLLQGAGNPSAAINMVRKRPTLDYQLKAEIGAGSWDNYRTQLDVGGPLNAEGTLRGRTVLMYNNRNSYQDYAGKENQLFYAIGEADLSDSTTLTVGGSVQQDNNNGYDWGGLPTRLDGSFYDLSRSTSTAGKWAYLDKLNRNVFADIKHSFNEDWNLTVATNLIWSNADFLAQVGYHTFDTDSSMQYYPNSARYDDEQINLDAALNGAFNLMGRKHEVVVGTSMRRDRLQYVTGSPSIYPTVDVLDFDSSQFPKPEIVGNLTPSRHVRKDKGIYAATRLNPADDLHVILGSRLSWVDYDTQGPWETDRFKEDRKVIPYGGIVYDITDQTSVYASYTEIYKLQSNYSVDNKLLTPTTGSNYEIGLKNELFDGRLNASLALFQVDQAGLPQVVPEAGRVCGPTRDARCYTEGAKVRNRGFDAEVSGELMPGWNASMGYTYSHPKYVAGARKGDTYGTENSPQRLFKAATTYQLPGELDQWRVGTSVYHQSKLYLNNITQSAYNLVDLNANYRVNQNVSVQLNLNNVFDEKYYTAIFSEDTGNYYGAPRNFALTLRYEN